MNSQLPFPFPSRQMIQLTEERERERSKVPPHKFLLLFVFFFFSFFYLSPLFSKAFSSHFFSPSSRSHSRASDACFFILSFSPNAATFTCLVGLLFVSFHFITLPSTWGEEAERRRRRRRKKGARVHIYWPQVLARWNKMKRFHLKFVDSISSSSSECGHLQ